MNTTKYIIAGNFIDGTGAPSKRSVYLQITGSTIEKIGNVEELPPDSNENLEDLSHCTIVPALSDSSASFLSSPALASPIGSGGIVNPASGEELFKKHTLFFHSHGVLGIVTPESKITSVDKYLREKGLTHMLTIRALNSMDHKELLPQDIEQQHDFVKINYSRTIEEYPADPEMTKKDLLELVRNNKERKVIVRANGQQAVKDALEAGCDAIEQGYDMGEKNLQVMASKNVLWIPSVLRAKNGVDSSTAGGSVCCRFSLQYAAPGQVKPGAEKYWKGVLKEQLKYLKKAREKGVLTAVGTGAGHQGILHGESVVEELKLFIKSGYTLEEAIQCATKTGPDFFEMDDLGPLTVGRKATFLVTRGTPKQLPRKLSYLEAIYINGASSGLYSKDPRNTT